jgi:dTDP-glucose pyrophosphorylase
MKKWELSLVPPNTKLTDAIKAIDLAGLQIAVVVDDKRRVLGTVTDGDVRRALINRISLDTPIDQIMSRNPRVAGAELQKELIVRLMEKTGISQMPVVNSVGEIVGIETFHSILSEKKHKNVVFLMAGGFGKRLYPLTKECPKPLLCIGGKPILEIIIENFVRAGFYRFYISTHFMPDLIQQTIGDGDRWNCKIEYILEAEPMGTAGAIGLLPDDVVVQPMVVMNCDLLTNLNFNHLLDFHRSHRGVATICVREYDHSVPYGVIETDGIKVKSVVEKPVYRHFVNAGIYVVSPEFLQLIPRGARSDMTTVLQEHVKRGSLVNTFPVHEYWLDIGRPEDFDKAQDDVLRFFD